VAWTSKFALPTIEKRCGKNQSSTSLCNDMNRIENDASNNFTVAYVFAAAVTFLPSSCLTKIRGCTYKRMGGIYDVCHSDGLRCHDTHTKFHTDLFRHSQVYEVYGRGDILSNIHVWKLRYNGEVKAIHMEPNHSKDSNG
jgi:hypothetical protein